MQQIFLRGLAILTCAAIPTAVSAQRVRAPSALLAGVTTDLVWQRWEGDPFVTLRVTHLRDQRMGFDLGIGPASDLKGATVDLGVALSTVRSDASFMVKAGIGMLRTSGDNLFGVYSGVAGVLHTGRWLAIRIDVTPHVYAANGRSTRMLSLGAGVSSVLRRSSRSPGD